MRRALLAVGGLTLLAAALRFPTVGAQSFWYDEAVTAGLLKKSLGGMLSALPDSESTPPVYYVLAWMWAKALGHGEAGIRALSALAGVVTVPVAFLAGRRLVTERAGVAAAALAAVSPLLVWYSQDARSYALLVLLAAASLWLFARARDTAAGRGLLLWAIACGAALATHYFAVFVVAPEAALLLWSPRTRRAAAAATAAIAAGGLALLPLAADQASNGGADFIGSSSLAGRIARAPKQFLLGYDSPAEVPLSIAAAALVLLGVYLLVRRGEEEERRGASLCAGIAAAALGAPLLLSVAGVDFFLSRNLIAAWLPAALVAGAGFGARRAGRAGPLALAGLAAICVYAVIAVQGDARYQRDDWKDAAASLGPPATARAVVVTPASGRVPMQLYLPGAQLIPPAGARVTEIDLIGLTARRPEDPPRPPRAAPPAEIEAGFKRFARIEAPTYTVVRYRATRPLTWLQGGLAVYRLGPSAAAVLYQPPGR